MKVIDFLNEFGLEKLESEFSIKVNKDYKDLIVLNYNQIESPKTHQITKECRSLVVKQDNNGAWIVVSRAFDRFFNYGEDNYHPNVKDLTCYEKLDGSLVSVFFYEGEWLYRTKSVIMPKGSINAFEDKWDLFIEEALDWGAPLKIENFDTDKTYIFEVTGKLNRVVTNYTETKAWLLSVRDNKTGEYYHVDQSLFPTPKSFKFSSTEECLEIVKHLPNLEEGYVAYNTDGVPVCKIKSPSYVAAHRIRGEGLTPSRIMDLVVINEQDEYIAVFPEDTDKFTAYVAVWHDTLPNKITSVWNLFKGIEDQKEFALNIKDFNFSSLLFMAKRNKTHPLEELTKQKDTFKIKLLTQAMKGV
jgi:T4 RnlA family RNA ligase